MGLVSGRSVGDVADYATYYHHISPWGKYCKVDQTGEANVVERNMPGHMLEQSAFYNVLKAS